MAAAFPFTSTPSMVTSTSPSSNTTTTTITGKDGGGGGDGITSNGPWNSTTTTTTIRRTGTDDLLFNAFGGGGRSNMVVTSSGSSSSSSTTATAVGNQSAGNHHQQHHSSPSMACDKCRHAPDSFGELYTLPCLHSLCRRCFQTQGNYSHQQQCPICGQQHQGNGDHDRTSSQQQPPKQSQFSSLFNDFPSAAGGFSSLLNRQQQQQADNLFSSPSPDYSNSNIVNPMGVVANRNMPSSYLFNEQLNVDTSQLIGSLLDSVSLNDDVLQLQSKGLQSINNQQQRRTPMNNASSTSINKFPITSSNAPPVPPTPPHAPPPTGFRVLSGGGGQTNSPTSGTISPSFFHQLAIRPIQPPSSSQGAFSLAVGGHRTPNAAAAALQFGGATPTTPTTTDLILPGGGGSLKMMMTTPTSNSSSSSYSTTTSARFCSICTDGADAVCRCEECAEFLCVKCVQAHLRVRLTKDHRIVPIFPQQQQQQQQESSAVHSPSTWPSVSNSPTMGQQQQQQSSMNRSIGSGGKSTHIGPIIRRGDICYRHINEPFGFYCETCPKSEVMCRFCVSEHSIDFPRHTITSFGKPEIEKLPQEAQSFVQMINEIRSYIRFLDEAVRGVDRMTERVETRMHSVANEIRGVIHHHIGALEERKRELLERVDAVRTAKLNSLNGQKEDLRKCLATSKSTLEQADKLVSTGARQHERQEDDTETAAQLRNLLQEHINSLKTNRPSLNPLDDDQLSFSAPDANLLKTVRGLGSIITGAYAPNCTLLGDPVRRAIKDKPIYYTVQARDHVGEPLTNGGDQVNGYVVSIGPDGTPMIGGDHLPPTVVDIQDKRNGTYCCRYEPDQEGEHQVHIFVRGCPIRGSPFTLIVRRGRDYTTIGPTPVLSFGGEGTGDGALCRPWGICCDKLGRIIIADRSNSRVQIFDQEGKFLTKFGSPGCRNGQFDRPAGVSVNSKNQIIVVDKDNHRVQVFAPDGQFMFKFGEKGRANGQFNYPWDVAVSAADDSIAISDTRNHRVQLFDSRGTYTNKFGFESSLFYKQFDSPRGLVFAPDGRLFCTDFNNHRLAVIDVVHNQMEFFGREGEYDGAFKRPQGLDMDMEGHLLIADSRNNRVQVFTSQLTFLCSIGIDGFPPRGKSIMDRPCDICVCEGKIFVVDFGNNKIHVY